MLVLSRKVGEQIVIGDGIVVTLVQAQSGQVRLGIEAPAQVRIVRRELDRRPLPGGRESPLAATH